MIRFRYQNIEFLVIPDGISESSMHMLILGIWDYWEKN